MGDQFAKMFLIAFVVGIMVAPLWHQVAIKFGKKTVFCCMMIIIVFCFLYTGTLTPGETSFMELLLLKLLHTAGIVGVLSVSPAILADIIDYAHWKTGVQRSATYFSIRVFLEKTSGALGAALALGIASWYGFVVTEVESSPESIKGLKIAMVWVPVLLGVLSLVFIIMMPINERRRRIIKLRLDARLKRSLASRQDSKAKQSSRNIQAEIPLNAS